MDFEADIAIVQKGKYKWHYNSGTLEQELI